MLASLEDRDEGVELLLTRLEIKMAKLLGTVKLTDICNGRLVKMKEMIIVADENKFDVAWLRLSEKGINNG